MYETMEPLFNTLTGRASDLFAIELGKVLTTIGETILDGGDQKSHEIVLRLTFKPDKKKPQLYDISISCDDRPGKNRPL